MSSKVLHHGLGSGALVLSLVGGLLVTACTSQTFDGPEKLGGKWISAKTLNLGHDTYLNNCVMCHGYKGDGEGPAARGSNPPPRNFTQGTFKFGSVTSGELPTDDDLKHTIRYGLRGTPMLPWDISDERLDAVVQYIKTFSPVWKTAAAGTPQPTTPDPWGKERAGEAILLGKKVYHGLAQCYTCHPTYASPEEIDAYSKEMTGNSVTTVREHPELSILQVSSYRWNSMPKDTFHKYMPPDYTKSWIKTGGDIPSLYKVLGTGVGGTSMPSWKGMLSTLPDEKAKDKQSEERLWALAYYVNSLHNLKFDEAGRKKFFEELDAKRNKTSVKTAQK